MKIQCLRPHLWVIDAEIYTQAVLVRFDPNEIQSAELNEELEFSICYAYKEHLDQYSDWAPHVYTVRDEDVRNVLSGKVAFI